MQKDPDELLSFYAFPATPWQTLRTTKPIESTFGTIRHRTTWAKKGCIARDTLFHMMSKLGQYAEKAWCRLRGFNQLPNVIERIHFVDGIEESASDSFAA